MNMLSISVVIPVYNNAQCLQELIARLFFMGDANRYTLEVIITDDGSTVDTWHQLRYIKKQYPNRSITLLRLDQNYGQHYATLCGLQSANNNILITLDADLQHQPEDIPLLVQTLTTGQHALVYGISNSGHPWHYQLSSLAFRQLTRTWQRPVYNGSGFRCFKKDLLEKLLPHTHMRFFFLDAIFPQLSQNITSIPTNHLPREIAGTHYNTIKRLRLFLKVVIFHASTIQLITILLCGIVFLLQSILLFQSGNPYYGTSLLLFFLLLTSVSLTGLINKSHKAHITDENSRILEKIE